MTAQQQMLLLPVFLHMLMTMGLGLTLGLRRRNAVLKREVKIPDIVLDNRNWPESLRKLGNNFDNQFQLPMLWYAGVAFTLILGLVDKTAIFLSAAFFTCRALHSLVHIGPNILVRRFQIFALGAFVLVAYWLWLAFLVFISHA